MTGPVNPEDLDPVRPQPLADAAADVAKVQAPIIGLITALVSGGLIGVTTSHWIIALLGLVPGLFALLGTIVGAGQVVHVGVPLVTPVADPQNNAGQLLVPAPEPPVDPVTS